MRQLKLILIGAVLFGALGANTAWANGGHGHGHWGGHHGGGHWRGHIGFFVGAPLFWYPQPAYYYPPAVVVVPAAPVVYVEQTPPAPPAQQYWYYCGNPQGYYPNVRECPSGWQKVLPQPVR